MTVSFVKAHGAGNDFLFTPAREAATLAAHCLPDLARAICDRHQGVGADGWYVIEQPVTGAHASITLYNSDGSGAELSGNGTRCAAALLFEDGLEGREAAILTGAGRRVVRPAGREGRMWRLEMEMGPVRATADDLDRVLDAGSAMVRAAILDVGNPQCAVVVDSLDFDWAALGSRIENHPHFPRRTNVSFVRAVDGRTVEARFFERGAGATRSSGTGAVGAAVAAMLRGLVKPPVAVRTEGGLLEVAWPGFDGWSLPPGQPIEGAGPVYLTGEAAICARGQFFW